MPLDLILFLGTIAAFLIVGLPAIRANVSLPRRLDIQEVADGSFSTGQREFFTRHDELLAPLGYHPLTSFRVLNLGGPNLSRLYRDRAGPGLCAVSTLTSADGNISTSYTEFIQPFQDGTRLTTRNTQISDVLEPAPGHLVFSHAAVSDPAELKRLHDLKLQELGKLLRIPGSTEDILRRANDLHVSFCEHQVALGLFRLDAAAGRYRATTKLGLVGIWSYLNPFADTFTWARLALALAAGVGLPVLLRSVGPANPDWAGPGTTIARYFIAGLAVGLTLQAKAFVWAFLLGWTTLRFLPDSAVLQGVAGAAMAVAAELGSRLRNRWARLA